MFALGCLIYTVHSHGRPPMENRNSIHNYRKNIERLSSTKYDHLPYHLHEVMYHLITRYPSQRMTAAEFQSSKYFDNVLVSTVKFFESFPEKTKDDKISFMKGLIRILPQFPERVLLRKILPCLLQEIKDHSLLPYTLPNIFFIAQKLSPVDFCEKVLRPLKPIFVISEPVQSLVACLDQMELFKQKTTSSAFKDDVMPLIYNSLEAKSPVVQEKALRVIPTIIDSLDILTIKSSLFPRIQNLFVHTTILAIKVTTLICLHSLVKSLDNFTLTEKLMPLLKGIKTKEPSVMITTLAVYDEMGKHVEKDVIATEILPQLWKLSVVPTLNLDQFQKFMKSIKLLSTRVEEEHCKQLQDIKNIEEHTKQYMEGGNEKNKDEVGSSIDFEKLVGTTSGMTNSIVNGQNKVQMEMLPNSFPLGTTNLLSSNNSNVPLNGSIQPDITNSLNSIPSLPNSLNSISPLPNSLNNIPSLPNSLNSIPSLPNSLNSIPSLPPPKNGTTPRMSSPTISTYSSNITSELFNTIPGPKFSSGSILQPSILKPTNNTNSGNQKISQADLTMFDPFSK
ncbi:hypothetical protein C2G38_2009413 [Gigaspora rosea]|uniref:Protein kinase domain-containing protein n=1 Tax=Gigaspora rosea TaxID=44941 RepID=A0A397TX72_9GLOM|nr:hypothetical protein C2G38_2009413 [Gigaspora rosea]